METDLKQLEPIRRQAAKIRAMINHLSSLHVTGLQAELIEDARLAFNTIIARDIRDLRKEAGDEHYKKMERIDTDAVTSGFSYRPAIMIDEIEKEIENLIRATSHELRATDGESQVTSHESLLKSVKDFKNFEFGLLKNAFGMGLGSRVSSLGNLSHESPVTSHD